MTKNNVTSGSVGLLPKIGSGIRRECGEGLSLRIGSGDMRGSAMGLTRPRVAKNEAEKMDGISMFVGSDLSNEKMTKRKMKMTINLCRGI